MTNDTRLATEARNIRVAGIARAERIQPDKRLPSRVHPVARKRPARALPQVVRAERLNLRARVHRRGRLRARGGVVARVDDLLRARRVERAGDDGLEVALGERRGECAVDRERGLVEHGAEEDRLALGGEWRSGIERGCDERAVTHDADGLSLPRGAVREGNCVRDKVGLSDANG